MSFLENHILYDRLSSNNSARIRLWLYARGLQDAIEIVHIKHEDQLTESFRSINPQGKIPALRTPWKPYILYESSVILDYLERLYQKNHVNPLPVFFFTKINQQALMNMIIRIHDLYIASPNCSQPGFTHTQGCMYLPPNGRRGMDNVTRSAKLAEIWKQLDTFEYLCQEPYLVGEISLADLTLFPSFVYFEYFLPRVFEWSIDDIFYKRPKLKSWYYTVMIKHAFAAHVKQELLEAIAIKPIDDITKSIKSSPHKWKYP